MGRRDCPGERRARSRGRFLRRPGLPRQAGDGSIRFRRPRPHRGAARSAGHALRQEHLRQQLLHPGLLHRRHLIEAGYAPVSGARAAGIGYAPPSLNPYDRLADIDAALKVSTNEGGVSAIADWDLGPATLTSVTAWRYWNWDAANDRDYTHLSIQTQQHIPSRQDQYSQELRCGPIGRPGGCGRFRYATRPRCLPDRAKSTARGGRRRS